ncbi:MAG: RNA pseudouridine synthase, partial [Burkholderiales bacterium]|nr:RNA pseudouridine synthase [Burkholderiales bacterium]
EPGQTIRVPPLRIEAQPARAPGAPDPADIRALRDMTLFEDDDVLVLNKPSGLAVQGGSGTKRHIDGMLESLAKGDRRPALVHRLDRDTSGCLVLARHARGASKLGRLFSSAAVKKTYWAIVQGAPPALEGAIDRPLKKITGRDGWRMAPDAAGQRALTRYRVLGSSGGLAWLELAPETGRTHQLRVHCAAEGFPVLGDPVYGREPSPRVPLHLHARSVTIPLGGERGSVTVTAEPPEHMRTMLGACGYSHSPPL